MLRASCWASLALAFGRDPAAHVLGAVDDLDARHFNAREEPHRGAIDEGDVPEIEHDPAVRRGREQLLQPRCVLGVEHSAEDENIRAGLCGLMNSVRHLRAPFIRVDSRASASTYLTVWRARLPASPAAPGSPSCCAHS